MTASTISHGAQSRRARGSLGRALVAWFLVLSLLPLALVSVLSYRSARSALRAAVAESLTTATELKAAHIKSHFDRMLTDLCEQSESQDNTEFLQMLVEAYGESGKAVSEFVKSFQWELLVDEKGADLRNFQKLFGYHDVFLIDRQGNVLFTVAREDNLGSNLFSGKYSDSLFAAAARKSLDSGQPVFSDFESHAPSAGMVSGFLVAPILDEGGDKIGLCALQSPADEINAIMQTAVRLGTTDESYLIGVDLTMRSNSRPSEGEAILGRRVDTEQARLWLEHHGASGDPVECQHASLMSYKGYRGARVLGSHRTIVLAGVRLGMIAEIEEREAFAAARGLATVSAWLVGITAVLVVLLSSAVARRIAKPLRELAVWARRVGEGDLSYAEIRTPPDETGVLNESLREAVASLRKAETDREVRDWRNTGIARLNDVMRARKDVPTLCTEIVRCLAQHLGAQVGTISLVTDDDSRLARTGAYAYKPRPGVPLEFKLGEGLIGQAAQGKERILITDVRDNSLAVVSALGETLPRNILCVPFLYEGDVKGVIELGSLESFTDVQMHFLDQVGESIAIVVHSAQLREQTEALLEESQSQGKKLLAQQEQLRVANEELQEKTEELQAQEEQLRAANEELEEKTEELQAQQEQLRAANREQERGA